MLDHELFERCAEQLIHAGRDLYGKGWSPATSSNYSMRLDDSSCAITVSGKHKGQLGLRDIMAVDLQGKPLVAGKPSAETLLHTQLYRRDAGIGAVLHTHSVNATVLTMALPGDALILRDYELQKAFTGVTSHEGELCIPVYDNTQDIAALAQQVDARMQREGTGVAYLIRGHGLYTWAENLTSCLRHVEAMEFLLECEYRRMCLRTQAG